MLDLRIEPITVVRRSDHHYHFAYHTQPCPMPKNTSNNPPTKNRFVKTIGVAIAIVIAGIVWYQKQPKSRQRQIGEATRAITGVFRSDGIKVSNDLDYGELPVFAGVPRDFDYGHELKLIDNGAFAVGYCEERECAAWVAYRCFKIDNPITHDRPSDFRIDERTTARVSHNDCTGSGFDRGHLAPNYVIDLCYGAEA